MGTELRLHEGQAATTTVAERAGEALGKLAGPLFAATSAARRARTFHPRGDCAEALVEVAPAVPDRFEALARRLEGPAFLRFSDALTKKKARWPDVLGCAIRFGYVSPVDDGDQDLLFATIKRPWTMPFSPFTTRVADWLANDYFAVSPFEVDDGGRVYFRLRPEVRGSTDLAEATERGAALRRASFEHAIVRGTAAIRLEVGPGPRGPFEPLVHVQPVSVWTSDPPDLHFDPFHTGRGIEPVGFVHALRRGVYAASQRARDEVQGRGEPVTT